MARGAAPRAWCRVAAGLLALAVVACQQPAERTVAGGDPERGAAAITSYGCGACHVVPGVAGADGTVGPPLSGFARRVYVGGEVENSADELVRWIMDPHAIEPRTAMPNLGVTERDARDIAAYLYTLR